MLTTRFRPAGKGTQAPKIKEKFNCCHLVRSTPQISLIGNINTLLTQCSSSLPGYR